MPRSYVDTSAGQIHLLGGGEGPPLLLLGSAGRSSRMFAELVAQLSGRFRVLAPDLPGFGQSAPLAEGTRIEALADLLAEMLDRLGLAAVSLYGFHTGNKIAAALAVRHPARISRLILAGQSHSLIPDNGRRNGGIRHLVVSHVALDGPEDPAAVNARLARDVADLLACGRRHPLLGGAIVDHVLDAVQATGTSVLYRANLAFDLDDALRRIEVPTLVLEVVTQDEAEKIGLQGPELLARIRGAQWTRLEVPEHGVLTLENRAGELAAIISRFAAPS